MSALDAAHAARTEGDWASVLRHAKLAVAADQYDTKAQALLTEAGAELGGAPPVDEADLRTRFCARPFQELEIRADGQVFTCCSAWLPTPIGNLRQDSLETIWNSAAAQEIRRSIHDGDYRHCSRLYCPALAGRRLPRRESVAEPFLKEVAAERRTRIDRHPRRVLMSQDRSCNIACPSCRDHLILAGKEEVRRLNRLVEEQVVPFLGGVEEIKVTGAGDPFGSAHFRWLLKRLAGTGIRLQLQTNGVLLDARAWAELQLEGRVGSVWVSSDAADPVTYAVVRCGGDWGRLLANLAFLGSLRAQGRLDELRLDFVVQTRNFREMPALVELARALGCGGVYFQMIRNWGTYPTEIFPAHFVGAPDHPDFPELVEVLRHPALDWPGIDFSNMAELRRQAVKGALRPIGGRPASGSCPCCGYLGEATADAGCPRCGSGPAERATHGLQDVPPGGAAAPLPAGSILMGWSGLDSLTGLPVRLRFPAASFQDAVRLVDRLPGCALIDRGEDA